MTCDLCDRSSEYLVDSFSSDCSWQVARGHFIRKGYRGKYLLIGRTKTGFRVWQVDLHKPQRYIPVTIYGIIGTTGQLYTAKDIVQERSELRHRAFDMLSTLADESIKHIVYYADERNENDDIVHASLYPFLLPMTDESFYLWAAQQGGLVGAVHRL